jgi:hypothetical protein
MGQGMGKERERKGKVWLGEGIFGDLQGMAYQWEGGGAFQIRAEESRTGNGRAGHSNAGTGCAEAEFSDFIWTKV